MGTGLGLEGAIGGKQRDGARLQLAVGEHFNRFFPGGFLPVVDLAQVEHVTLDDAITGTALVLDDAPVAVRLAVFDPRLAAQKHLGRALYRENCGMEQGRSALQAVSGPFRGRFAHESVTCVTIFLPVGSNPRSSASTTVCV